MSKLVVTASASTVASSVEESVTFVSTYLSSKNVILRSEMVTLENQSGKFTNNDIPL